MKPLLAAVFAACLLNAETFPYWIEPCAPAEAECEANDEQLAAWAMQAWQGVSAGGLSFVKSPKAKARIRLYWSSHGNPGLYGEARMILVDGKPGAEVLVRPSLASLGPQLEAAGSQDRLFRHTVIYLTCLHELGHALGMPHTRSFNDIMYSFQYGGDIPEYFMRYRRKLKTLEDIRANSGLSADDEKRLLSLYKTQ